MKFSKILLTCKTMSAGFCSADISNVVFLPLRLRFHDNPQIMTLVSSPYTDSKRTVSNTHPKINREHFSYIGNVSLAILFLIFLLCCSLTVFIFGNINLPLYLQ